MADRVTAETIPGATVTPAVARALIDQARHRHGYTTGILGVRARPEATREASFTHRDQAVRVVPAASALAVREAIRDADPDGWLVVVTDRTDADLGDGLLAQFTYQQMRHPDAWQALQQRFGAHSVDTHLLRMDKARQVATGLLELSPPDGWPPAPAGVLTREHALAAVARTELGLPDGPVDLITVLQWSTHPALPGTIARLRGRAGDVAVDAVLAWVADAAGEGAPFVAALLSAGTPTDLVPLGIVLDCLLAVTPRQEAEVAIARLQHRWGDVPRPALVAAGRLAGVVVSGMLGGRTTEADAKRLIARADDLLAEAQAAHLASGSRQLRAGLTLRLRTLAEVLRHTPELDEAALEAAWSAVAEHELADDTRIAPSAAGVRLARWLVSPPPEESTTLHDLAARHLHQDAWVDSAVNDAEPGVDDPPLAAALERVLQAVQQRRDAHDTEFAAAVAREGTDERDAGVLTLERVLPDVVLPLAQQFPTLLLVLDGMSAGVATEILAHATTELEYGLIECLVPGASTRTPALAVLPSVTEVSRASLLSGRLVAGQQDAERRGFAEATRKLGDVRLFHKGGLDTSRQGFALSQEARQAIANTEQYKLVGCVLNTIDDALDRTDPGGTDWTADTVKHLAPLLRAARASGRLVVLTSDHGHVVERRRGTQRGVGLGGRYRTASGPIESDEVLVEGARILTPDHRAVLAVNERLRYGPLKAGYHGGAAPAEVVVPVALLAPSTLTHDLAAAPVAEPAWWDLTSVATPVLDEGALEQPVVPTPVTPPVAQPDLFAEPAPAASGGVGAALLASDTFRSQKKLVARLNVTDTEIATLVEALASAPDRRLSATRVAMLLGVPVNRVPLAMSQVAKLLNVEGYPVVSSDPATQAVSLDSSLLTEQYGIVW